MYADQLETLLKKNMTIYEKFKGFYARDQLPQVLEEGYFYIGNTE